MLCTFPHRFQAGVHNTEGIGKSAVVYFGAQELHVEAMFLTRRGKPDYMGRRHEELELFRRVV